MSVTLNAGGVEPIPTLSEWGVGLLVALLGLSGLRQARERSALTTRIWTQRLRSTGSTVWCVSI